MATNKNKHFVPRCYLRPFTAGGAGVSINLYNLDRRKFIAQAPVKHQCSGDYFYGQDPNLESAIQGVEGAYADVVRRILKPSSELLDGDRDILRLFWLLQYRRTEAASQRAVVMNNAMADSVGIPEGDSLDFRLGIREAVQMAMHNFRETMDSVSDMKVCLLKNRTRRPFVTSDNPAVLCNRWYQSQTPRLPISFGLYSGGALLLIPLSPSVFCVGYDGDAYSVTNHSGWSEVRRERDVEALNEHQFLNCQANIYLRDPVDASFVHDSYLRIASRRPTARHRINMAILDKHEGDYSRYRVVEPDEARNHEHSLLHLQTIHPEPSAWPSIISWRHKGSVFTDGSGAGYVRHSRIPAEKARAYKREAVPG